MKKKTKVLLSSLLAISMSASLATGATYALFTSTSTVNVAVTSGTVSLTAAVKQGSLTTYSMGAPTQVNGTFDNGGTAAIEGNGLNLNLVTPGDKAEFLISTENESNVNVLYRVVMTATNGTENDDVDFVSALVAKATINGVTYTIGGTEQASPWLSLAAEATVGDIIVSVELPEDKGNEYQGKNANLKFVIEAVQGNASTEGLVVYATNATELSNIIQDGGSVVLMNDITIPESYAVNGNAVYYTGDKSITIDLNGHTLTGDTSNVAIRIQKAEGEENTITIKNGKIVSTENSWSAVSVGSSTTTKTYVNLENLEIEASKGNDFAVRARTGSVFTLTDCTINANIAGGVVSGGGDVVLNNVTVNQSGVYSNNWNSVAIGVSGGGTVTVNSGTYTASLGANDVDKGSSAVYIMSSGGNLIVNGGTFKSYRVSGNNVGTLQGIICADAGANVEIKGGNFISEPLNGATGAILDMRNNTGGTNPIATISGGTFSADPRISGLYASNLIHIATGYEAVDNGNGTWSVVRDYVEIATPAGNTAAQNGEALGNTINATTGNTFLNLGAGEYTMPSVGGNKEVTIVGTKDTVIDNTMGSYMDGSKVVFEGVTIKGSTGMVNGNGSDYAAFYCPDVTYVNCTFDGPFRIGRDGAKFINCTFTNLGNDYVWTYGNDVEFIGCTFETEGKAILIYSDGGNEVANVTVTGCKFYATQGAKAGAIANQNCAAIEIQNYGNGVNLTTSGNTHDSNFSGEWRIKTYHADRLDVIVNGTEYTTIAIDGKTMTIDGDRNVTVNQ